MIKTLLLLVGALAFFGCLALGGAKPVVEFFLPPITIEKHSEPVFYQVQPEVGEPETVYADRCETVTGIPGIRLSCYRAGQVVFDGFVNHYSELGADVYPCPQQQGRIE